MSTGDNSARITDEERTAAGPIDLLLGGYERMRHAA